MPVATPTASTYLTRVLRVRLRDKHVSACREQAFWVNQVWNYCNDLSVKVLQREGRFIGSYELDKYTSGSSKELPLHSQTIQAVSKELVTRRKQFRKAKLRWRVSNRQNPKYSLGWVPFKASAIRYRNGQVFLAGFDQPLSMWDSYGLGQYKLGSGCLSEDARGRWYLNITVKVPALVDQNSPCRAVGVGLGPKGTAVASNGLHLVLGHDWAFEAKLGIAQRAKKKERVRALHAKIKNARKDAMHRFARSLVDNYGFIFVGDVSTQSKIAKVRAKSLLDAGWGMLKTTLRYKCHEAGVWFEEVDDADTTQICSCCGEISASSPIGRTGHGIREWPCDACGSHHDRDVNAARNILAVGRDRLGGGIPAN